MNARVHTAITHEPLSSDAAHAFVGDPGAGAVVVFTGTVRNHADGRDVSGLTYEAYEEQARTRLAAVADEVVAAWPSVLAVWMTHRLGGLAIGEPSVVVAVSAAHRGEAFAAARQGIDTLKSTVPIWKQEHWADGGAHWPGTD
ncbi:MAG: molybdenum cofactor biosynthesis protein MoaE [Actinobacteria bacterium]|nr:molybdenum cofactor biosynthesis protein MoaE [Actinomycetota bacterium]